MIGHTRLPLLPALNQTDVVGARHEIREFAYALGIGALGLQAGVVRKNRKAIERRRQAAQLLGVAQLDSLHEGASQVAARRQLEILIAPTEAVVRTVSDDTRRPVDKVGDVLAKRPRRDQPRRFEIILRRNIVGAGILGLQARIALGDAAEPTAVRQVTDRGVGHDRA